MGPGVVGREAELAQVEGFLRGVRAGFSLLGLEGEAGIGKTTVWQEAVRRSVDGDALVLRCRPAAAEAKLSFAGLADLLEPVDSGAFVGLPDPQREALEVALLRTTPAAGEPIARPVAAGFLSLVRELAASRPVVVAVDDWQWLDAASRRVLEFAARRLDRERVGLLYSVRLPAPGPGVDPVRSRVRRVVVGPLSLAAIGRILSAQLDCVLPRPVLARIVTASDGNPFYALEIARLLAAGEPHDGADRYSLPAPEDLRKLTAARIRGLPETARESLLLASVLAEPNGSVIDLAALGPAEEADIVRVDAVGRVRFTHPLLASAAYGSVSLSRRRQLHRRAAELVFDREQRARHLALGSEQADSAVASQLDEAARLAASRGAPDTAAELAELTARLTPEEDLGGLAARRLAAGRFHFAGGDLSRAEELAQDLVAQAPADQVKADALQLLAQLAGRRSNFGRAGELAGQALRFAGDDDARRASIELEVAYCVAAVGDMGGAAEHAGQALLCAQRAGQDGSAACALACLTMIRFISGQGLDEEQLARALSLADPSEAPLVLRPRYLDGVMHLWMGDLTGSLERLGGLLDEAVELGQEADIPELLLYMVQARLAQGDFEQAARMVETAREAAVLLDDPTASAVALGASALAHAYQGRHEAGRQEARQALELFERLQWRAGAIWPMWALGLIELSSGHPAQVDQLLSPLCEQLLVFGGGDPSFFVFVPDEVEALVRLGELERAQRYLEPFARSAQALERDWAIALAERCRGMLAAARGDSALALESLERALAAHDRTEMRVDRARTLLIAGQTLRRFKQRRRAAELLGEAQAEFEDMGARAWRDMAAAELARVGLRVSSRDELTRTERQLAELAASGLSNQEVAERAFVSVKTVEANLTRVYRKLGVRSRVGLAAALNGSEESARNGSAETARA